MMLMMVMTRKSVSSQTRTEGKPHVLARHGGKGGVDRPKYITKSVLVFVCVCVSLGTSIMVFENRHSRQPSMASARGVHIKYRRLKPFSTEEIRVLLLENISELAKKQFEDAGYQVSIGLIHHHNHHHHPSLLM